MTTRLAGDVRCPTAVQGPPYSVVCNWLSIGGLIFTGILVLWNVNGALIIGATVFALSPAITLS